MSCEHQIAAAFAPDELVNVLTSGERVQYDRFQFEKRRHDWLIGRIVAKRLIARMVRERFGGDPPLSALAIGTGPTGAPIPVNAAVRGLVSFQPGDRLPLELSISHSHGAAFAAAFWHPHATTPGARIGADLEWLERRPPDLFDDYFTDEERRYCSECEEERDARATVIWSGKESALKAAGLGLTLDTRAVTCLPGAGTVALRLEPFAAWQPLAIATAPPLSSSIDDAVGCWRIDDGFAFTVVVARVRDE